MPPAQHETKQRISVSDAGRRNIGGVNAKPIVVRGDTMERTGTAITEATDEYLYCFINALPPGASHHHRSGGHTPVPCKLSISVKGRLKNHVEKWEQMGANKFVMDTIRHSYKIPFLRMPDKARFTNNRSALCNTAFVTNSILELLLGGRNKKMGSPTVVNPLSVYRRGEKKHIILDLCYVNTHTWKHHVKFEGWETFQHYLCPGCHLFDFDLQSGYHHIDTFEEHMTYLGFSWTADSITETYCFCVLPFGLTSAEYIFTKICRVPVKFWRGNGIQIVLYLDDGIGTAQTYEMCCHHAHFVWDS